MPEFAHSRMRRSRRAFALEALAAPARAVPGIPLDSIGLYRQAGVRCLGLYCLLDGLEKPPPVAVLRTALAVDVPAVRRVAAEALCDLALMRCAAPLNCVPQGPGMRF